MEIDLDTVLDRYNEFFDHLTDEKVEEYRTLASPSVRYRDPLTDAQGVDAVIAYLHKVCTDMDDFQIETKGYRSEWAACICPVAHDVSSQEKPKEAVGSGRGIQVRF